MLAATISKVAVGIICLLQKHTTAHRRSI